jgi:hypothetical protein
MLAHIAGAPVEETAPSLGPVANYPLWVEFGTDRR